MKEQHQERIFAFQRIVVNLYSGCFNIAIRALGGSAQPFSFRVVGEADYFNLVSLLEAQFILPSFDITAGLCLVDDLNRACQFKFLLYLLLFLFFLFCSFFSSSSLFFSSFSLFFSRSLVASMSSYVSPSLSCSSSMFPGPSVFMAPS